MLAGRFAPDPTVPQPLRSLPERIPLLPLQHFQASFSFSPFARCSAGQRSVQLPRRHGVEDPLVGGHGDRLHVALGLRQD